MSKKEKIIGFELKAMDLPFKAPFKIAVGERTSSDSIFLKCILDSGVEGWGECLPRFYVSREERDSAFFLLREKILPHLVGMEFQSFDEVLSFLRRCDGKAPREWVPPGEAQSAAWCAVDLALLDTFGRAFGATVRLNDATHVPDDLRYSAVISAHRGWKYFKTLLKVRLFGFRQVKLKVDQFHNFKAARWARRLLGARCEIRADANMAWSREQALEAMRELAKTGIRSFEQPIDPADTEGLQYLVQTSGLDVVTDESITDRESLERLVEFRACTGVNVRISKCGGLIAAYSRCLEALKAGMFVQIGCQVGESSLLSAANLILLAAVREVRFAEGCFGRLLLREDPVTPLLQFGYGGRPPSIPTDSGLGVSINPELLERFCVSSICVR